MYVFVKMTVNLNTGTLNHIVSQTGKLSRALSVLNVQLLPHFGFNITV